MMKNEQKMLLEMIKQAVAQGDIEQIRDQITPETVNLRDARRKETLLHFAASNGHREFLRLLIAAGANLNARAGMCVDPPPQNIDYDRYRQLVRKHELEGQPNQELVALTRMDGQTPLHKAAYAGHAGIVQDLIEAGAAVNLMHCGSLPLHDAAIQGHSEVVKLLVAAGSWLDRDSFSWHGTPLEIAHRKGHQDVVNILQKAEVAALACMHDDQVVAMDVGAIDEDCQRSPFSRPAP